MVSVFENWLRTLEKVKIRRPPNWVDRIDSDFDTMLAALGFATTLALSFGLCVHFFREMINSNLNLLGFLYISFCTGILVATAMQTFARSFVYEMWPHGFYPFIVLTKGDERNLRKFREQDLTRYRFWRRVFASTLSGLLVTLAGGLIASYLGISRH